MTYQQILEILRELGDLIENLIHNHGARFKRPQSGLRFKRPQFGLRLEIGRTEEMNFVEFDDDLRNFFSDILNRKKKELTRGQIKELRCIIYRIYCRDHPGFNYVGQTINDAITRGSNHHGKITRACQLFDDASRSGEPCDHRNLMAEHVRNIRHDDDLPLNEILRMEILRHLPDHGGMDDDENKRVRRAWEMFYQWLLRALEKDGGGSRR